MNKAGYVKGGIAGYVKGALSGSSDNAGGSVDWELRPGGMLVQKRDPNVAAALAGPMIKVKVSYGLSFHEVSIAAHSTFGDLKKALVQDTGLQPKQQRLLYKGKEKDNSDYLNEAGVKEKSKIILIEDPASREKRLIDLRRNEAIAKACKAIADIKQEVDKLAGQISVVEGAVLSGKQLPDNEFSGPTELLMCQLLKLDGIKADGDANLQRRILVRRVQKYVETLDALKIRNDMPNPVSSTVVTTSWETFDSGIGSLAAPPSSTSASLMTDWERFD